MTSFSNRYRFYSLVHLQPVGRAVQSISPLGSSFSDVAAHLAAVAGVAPSVVDCAIAQLQVLDCIGSGVAALAVYAPDILLLIKLHGMLSVRLWLLK